MRRTRRIASTSGSVAQTGRGSPSPWMMSAGIRRAAHRAKILHRDGKLLVVAEAGATNGTYLNGKRLEAGVPRAVRGGDSLAFGKVMLKLEID